VQKDFVAAAKAHPAFHVHNIEALRHHLLQQGVLVIEDEARAEENVRRLFLNDPFGNRIEFLEWL
jgi:catechol 2,3-dioxygenase-like lactoylglutathione lyase family enzyme